MSTSFTEAVITLVGVVSQADGKITREEESLLYHVVQSLGSEDLSPERARALLDEIHTLPPADARARMRTVLAGAAGLHESLRLRILAIGCDCSAVDEVTKEETDVLFEATELLGITRADRDALLYAMVPDEFPRAAPASPFLRFVHVGPWNDADFYLPLDARLTVFRIGQQVMVRIIDTGGSTELDYAPALLRLLIPITDETRLSSPPRVLRGRQLLDLVRQADEPWQLELDDLEWLGDIHLSTRCHVWRRGQCMAIEAFEAGNLWINNVEARTGIKTTVFAGDKLQVDNNKAIEVPATGPWDLISARTTMVVPPRRSEQKAARRFQLTDVTIRIPGKKEPLLKDVSFEIRRGQMVAVLGPSGSGKSTLIEVLSGQRKPADGEGDALALIEKAWVPMTQIRERVAVVPQDEVLLPSLTVLEHAVIAAQLRRAGDTSRTIQDAALASIRSVGLNHRKHTLVGSPERRILSGGQRRRVGVLQELVAEPDLLLLDEPLSGLSSQDARIMANLFKEIALNDGPAVVVVVHQPSREVFERFDKVLVLDNGGVLAFAGTPSAAIAYFNEQGGLQSKRDEFRNNPDVILAVMDQRKPLGKDDEERERLFGPDFWDRLYRKKHPSEEITTIETNTDPPPPRRRPSVVEEVGRFRTILGRHWRVRRKNKVALGTSFGLSLILGLMVALVTARRPDDDYTFVANESFIYFLQLMPIVAFFLGMVSSGTELVVERRLIKHENRFGVSVTSFIASKMLVLATFAVAETLILLLPALIYLRFPLMHEPGTVALLFALTLLVNWVGVAAGLCTSSIAPNLAVAFALIPLALIPQIVFGSLIPYTQMSPEARCGPFATELQKLGEDAPFFAQLMPARWAAEGLVVTAQRTVNAHRRAVARYDLAREITCDHEEASCLQSCPAAKIATCAARCGSVNMSCKRKPLADASWPECPTCKLANEKVASTVKKADDKRVKRTKETAQKKAREMVELHNRMYTPTAPALVHGRNGDGTATTNGGGQPRVEARGQLRERLAATTAQYYELRRAAIDGRAGSNAFFSAHRTMFGLSLPTARWSALMLALFIGVALVTVRLRLGLRCSLPR